MDTLGYILNIGSFAVIQDGTYHLCVRLKTPANFKIMLLYKIINYCKYFEYLLYLIWQGGTHIRQDC